MQTWKTFLDALQNELGAETIAKWLRPLKVVHFDAGNLYLEAQDSFQIEWFEEHVRPKAQKKFVNNNFRPIKIHISIASLPSHPSNKQTNKKKIETPSPSFTLTVDPLDPSFLFDQFIISSENKIVFQLLTRLTEEPSPSMIGQFNPIYLYGSSSTGKTHLLQALASAYQKKNKTILYIRAETFTENVVNAIRSGNMQDFRKAHRHVDVLIFDDVHQLAKKNATQEEFFHTFNSLHMQGKQIVLSSNVPPALLQEIEPRLVSRFEWGITLPLVKLEGEDLFHMVKQRCNALHFPLQESIVRFLLESFSYNLKSLHKSIEALIFRCHTERQSIPSSSLTLAHVKALIKDLIEEEKKQVLNPNRIISFVAHFYTLTPQEILSKSQTHECTLPRQVAMYLCRHELKMPFARIGQFFDRDHSTVISSVKIIEDKIMAQEKETCSAILSIRRNLEDLS
jgi:chromosomal replication initiator protein